MALKRIGNQIVLEGAGKYIQDSEKVNKAIEKTNQKLAQQVQAASKTALPDPSRLQRVADTIANIFKKAADAATLPFRAAKNIIVGTFSNVAKPILDAILLPFKVAGSIVGGLARITGMIFVASMKAIIAGIVSKQIASWLTGGGVIPETQKIGTLLGGGLLKGLQSQLPPGMQSIIQTMGNQISSKLSFLKEPITKLGSLFVKNFEKYGGDTAKTFLNSFSNVLTPQIQGYFFRMLSSLLGLGGGPFAAIGQRVGEQLLKGLSKECAQIGTGGAARLLGLSSQSIRNLADKGEIPFTTTPGGHRRFDPNVLKGLDLKSSEGISKAVGNVSGKVSEVTSKMQSLGQIGSNVLEI